MDHWGERCSILDLLFWERGRGGYIQVVIQLNENDFFEKKLYTCMEKIINDIITLFLFNILRLLCSYFLYIYLIFLRQRMY